MIPGTARAAAGPVPGAPGSFPGGATAVTGLSGILPSQVGQMQSSDCRRASRSPHEDSSFGRHTPCIEHLHSLQSPRLGLKV